MTKQEEQDASYRTQGFHPQDDFNANDKEGNKRLEEMVNFIARDGGEIRQGNAYEPDETTIKPGWVRLYWK